jgi:hypothetical protein
MKKSCERCGATFQITNRAEKRFCTDRCARRSYHSRAAKTPKEERFKEWAVTEAGSCEVCSSPLPIPRERKVKTCSRKCSHTLGNRLKKPTAADSFRKQLTDRLHRGFDAPWSPSFNLVLEGCTWAHLVAHLQQTAPGVNIRHRHQTKHCIDHIIPLVRFNLTLPEHGTVAGNWRNLRIIHKDENLTKCDTLDLSLIGPELLQMAQAIGVITFADTLKEL